MKEVPWLTKGGEATVLSSAQSHLKGKTVRVESFSGGGAGQASGVLVSTGGGAGETLRPWQLVEKGFRSSFKVRSLGKGIRFLEWQGYENNANAVLLGDPPSVLVDSGHFHLMGSLLVALAGEGVALESLKAVLYTHAHPDHFDSAGVLAQAGVPVGLHPSESEFLRGQGAVLFRFMGVSVPQVEVSISLEQGQRTVAGIELEITHTPGHSPGSVCLHWRPEGALCCGDVVFPGGAFGRCDFPGGSYRVLLDSVGLIDGSGARFLLSGHGPAVEGCEEVAAAIAESRGNLRSIVFSPFA